ncbi:MAG: CHAT domain-containing protein [Bacteroidota bacterium]
MPLFPNISYLAYVPTTTAAQSSRMQKPFVFLAFANSATDYLRFLEQESRGLLDIMLRLSEDLGQVRYDHRSDITTDQVYNILLRIRDRLSILHFSGHADSLHVHLENGQHNIQNLCQLLGQVPHLQLVVLNGCSTKGMVEALLEVGVKAVIATSVEVDDYKAAVFSEAFYQSFSLGNPLQKAFLDALSHGSLPPPPGVDATIVPRATFKRRHGAQAERDPIPWGLYFREEARHILEWRLERVDDTTPTRPTHPEITKLRRRATELKEELLDLRMGIEDYEDILAETPADHPRRRQRERRLKSQRAEYRETEVELDQCYSNITRFNREQEELDLAEQLREAIDKLNYLPQWRYFERIYQQQASTGTLRGAFIVQGSPMCGQEMLKERLVDLGGIRNEYKEIKIDFESLAMAATSPANIWERFQQALYRLVEKPLGADTTVQPGAIVREVYTRFFDQTYPQHLVILFNNIHTFTERLNLQLIREFWFVFSDHLDQLLDGQKLRSKLLLFIIDRDSELQQKDGEICGNKDQTFQAAFRAQDLQKYRTYLFPIIRPLAKTDLEQWYFHSKLPLDLGLNSEVFDHITGDEGNYMLPAIKALCEKTDHLEVYQRFYSDYEFQIPKL